MLKEKNLCGGLGLLLSLKKNQAQIYKRVVIANICKNVKQSKFYLPKYYPPP